MTSKRRRDRNAFLVFLAAVPISLLVAMPVAVTNGKAYVAAKEAKQMQAEREAQRQSGAGATAPQGGN
jgi:hypothetical protein